MTAGIINREAIGNYAAGWLRPLDDGIRSVDPPRIRAERVARTLAVGNYYFGMLRAAESAWREMVLKGTVAYDPAEEREFLECHRRWLEPTAALLGAIDELRLPIRDSEIFRGNVELARAILAGAPPFANEADAARWAVRVQAHYQCSRPISVDASGRLFETNGARFQAPGLDPDRIRAAIEESEPPGRRIPAAQARAELLS